MNKLWLLFIGVVFCTTLSAKDFNDISYYEKDAPAIGNITYRNERCKLDLRTPDDKTNFPTLVWFHGGGLRGGSGAIPPLPAPAGGLSLLCGCQSTASPPLKNACNGCIFQGRVPQQGARVAAILRGLLNHRFHQ